MTLKVYIFQYFSHDPVTLSNNEVSREFWDILYNSVTVVAGRSFKEDLTTSPYYKSSRNTLNRNVVLLTAALLPYSGKSHFVSYEPLLKELAARGHDITVVSHFPQRESLPRFRDIVLNTSVGHTLDAFSFENIPAPGIMRHGVIIKFKEFAENTCSYLAQKSVTDLIKSNENFDLILIEYFDSDCFLGFVHKFKVPYIGLSSCYVLPWHNDRFGNPDNPSYIPSHFGDFEKHMTFWRRLENTWMYVFNKAAYKFLIDRAANRIAKETFGNDLPPLSELALNSSLFLVNTHFSLNLPKPIVPGFIEVGGMNLGEPKNHIPKNIEKWINESTHGVIYFSMGSMIKGHTFPEEKRNMFLRAFGRLQQRVLWKWENDTMPKKPDNVMIQKWMPQFDILCHPNVKAFISHGGLLGTTEAVHCGVPAVVMPQYGDQYTNARALEASGGGVILQFSTLTEEDVYNSLKTVLDPSFNKKAKELSERFRDRPMPPLETAIYWVEYVARHKGAPHLRTAAVGMPLYQYLLLDVIAFLLLVFAILTYTSYVVIKFIFRKLFKKQTKEKEN